MSHEIQIPAEVQHVVEERNKIWAEFDSAKGRSGQLNQLIQRVGGIQGQVVEVRQPLSQSDNPVDELNQVVAEVNRNLAEVDNAEREIQSTQRQIGEIQQRAQSMTWVVVAGVIILILIVIFVII